MPSAQPQTTKKLKVFGYSPAHAVFILMAVVVSVAYLFSVFTRRTTLETKDFVPLVMMAFTFFFSYKGKPEEPYAGK